MSMMIRSLASRTTKSAKREEELAENRPHVLHKLKTKKLASAADLIVHVEDHIEESGTIHGTLDVLHRTPKQVRLQHAEMMTAKAVSAVKAVSAFKALSAIKRQATGTEPAGDSTATAKSHDVDVWNESRPASTRLQRRISMTEAEPAPASVEGAGTGASPCACSADKGGKQREARAELVLQSRACVTLCAALGATDGASKGLALEALVDALEAFGKDVAVAQAAAQALGDLAANCDTALRSKAAEEGAFQELLDAVRANPRHVALRLAVNRALLRLTGDDDVQVGSDGRTTPLRERMAEKFFDANEHEVGFLWP